MELEENNDVKFLGVQLDHHCDWKLHAQSPRKCGQTGSFSLPTKQTSMCSLIIWNISKALEENPCMDLRHAMRSAHERFDRESRDEIEMISQTPEERHLTCAILAWQQLGHKDTDSLYQFIEQNRNKPVQQTSENSNNANIDIVNKSSVYSKPRNDLNKERPVSSKDVDTSSFDTKSLMGPVVKLPVETKIIMRMESTPCSHHTTRKTQKNPNDIMNKIDAACCMDSACVQRLADLDTAVCELRSRAAKLARREAERVELLERAEAAWKDLELGFQRRLALALEKEDDITKQIKKTIEERNGYKGVCTELAKNVKEVAQVAEKERDSLTLVEKDLCDRACVRLRLSEEAARGDSALAEQLCKASQMDRDLQFKEDQVRRKVSSLESEIQSARCLTHEAEITLRAELGMLKEQITQVSNQLLNEESEVKQIKAQLEELQTEKVGLLEDLDGCKTMCDNRMQGKVNELKQKREDLMKLKEKVIECRCKIPLDEAIEVKRTPSLAALCQCSSEEKLLDTCSCTSIRTQLLSTLLSDLFGGLQSELGGSGSTMPCQLLKCLEDKHNWDRSSVVKSNLRIFFEQLLVSELDIAIATSIEKYHAKWIGKSCADRTQVMPYSVRANDATQEQDIERRAQKMATKLAEQLFNERADQITKRAKEIMSKGPPPCECRPQPAVFQCLVKRPNTTHVARKNAESPPSYFKRALQDVTQLKVQVEDLRKESVKKEDLRLMEGKIARIVKRASKQNSIPLTNKKIIICTKDVEEKNNENTVQNGKTLGLLDISENKSAYNTKQNIIKSNQYRVIENKKKKVLKNIEQSYAVNMCLCGTRDNLIQDPPQKDNFQLNISKNKMETVPSYKMSQISPIEDAQANKFSTQTSCPSECVCFHKIPSNTSIEKLLETLLNRKGDKKEDLYKSILHNQSKENQTNDNNPSLNLSVDIKQNKSTIYLPVNGIDKISLEDNLQPAYPCDLVPECCSNKDGHDIGTDYDAYPNTTNSEYIGAINLDKSNDNSFKYTNHDYNKLKYGDGQDVCMKSSEETKPDLIHKVQNPNSCKLDFKKESQVYSVQANSRFKCVEKELLSNIKKDLEVSETAYVGDVLKKSDLLSDDCDYNVKFLGVTLTNTIKNTKESDENNTISTFTNFGNENPNNLEVKSSQICTKKLLNSEIQCTPIKRNSRLLNTLSDENNKILKNTPDIINNDQTKCICCYKDEYNDLEVNAFNLLEEHLKEKLVEFQRSSYKSERITAEEQKLLFSNILNKVKEVVSENTNRLSCKCMGLYVNEESWKRAYCLLQEYLKVKMKRVQCSCITNDSSIENILPAILDKVSNLIDNDFQRLRDQCKCENEMSIGNVALKNSKEQMTESILQYNDMFVQYDNSNISNQHATNFEDTSIQAFSIFVDDKSCEACEYNNTAEKEVSCEYKSGYITDCKCRYTISEPSYLDFNITGNQSILTKCIKFKCNKLQAVEIKNDTPASISSNLLKEQLEVRKNTVTKITDPLCTNDCNGYKSIRSCVRSMEICHCDKSAVETKYEKNDRISNSVQENPSNSLFYIMNRIPNHIRSEHICIDKINGSISQQKDLTSSCDVEITADNEEEIVLKYSKEECCLTDTSNNTSLSNVTKCKKCSSNWYDCSGQQIDNEKNETDYESNKNSLYDSLYLPTDHISQYKKYVNVKDSNVKDPDSEICNCKMVPICHVKMLVESIQQKLVQSKCTCDSLCSRVCPIHALEKFYY